MSYFIDVANHVRVDYLSLDNRESGENFSDLVDYGVQDLSDSNQSNDDIIITIDGHELVMSALTKSIHEKLTKDQKAKAYLMNEIECDDEDEFLQIMQKELTIYAYPSMIYYITPDFYGKLLDELSDKQEATINIDYLNDDIETEMYVSINKESMTTVIEQAFLDYAANVNGEYQDLIDDATTRLLLELEHNFGLRLVAQKI